MPNIAIKLERTGSRNPGSSSQIALHFLAFTGRQHPVAVEPGPARGTALAAQQQQL